MGTQGTTVTSVLQVSSNHNKVPRPQGYLDPRIKSCFPEYPKLKHNSRGIPETPVTTQENTERHKSLRKT